MVGWMTQADAPWILIEPGKCACPTLFGLQTVTREKEASTFARGIGVHRALFPIILLFAAEE